MTTLGEYAKVQGGFAYKSKDFIGASEYRVLKIKNVRFGTIDYSEPAFVPKNIAESTINWKLKEGDILISMTGSGPNAPQSLVGRVARVWKNEPDAWFNQRVGRINLVDNKKIHPDFIFYWLSLPQNQDFLVANSSGSANQANISGKTIESLPTPIVDYEISSAIAKIARELDEKIILNTQINQTLEKIAQAIFKSWFVDFDPVKAKIETLAAGGSADDAELAAMSVISFKALDELSILKASNPEAFNKLAQTAALFPAAMQDTELGEIPEGWGIKSIYDICNVIYGAPFKSKLFNTDKKGLPLVRIRDLKNESPGVFTEEVHSKGYLIQNGDIVVGMDGEFRPYIWGGNEAWMNQRVCCFKPTNENHTYLVRNFIDSQLSHFEKTATATTVIHLGKGDIDTFSYIDAGEKIFNLYAEKTSSLCEYFVRNKIESLTLSQLRDSLLPKLLSGEIDLTSEVTA